MNPCQSIPHTITSGDGVTWTENYPEFPVGSYTLTLWLALKLGTAAKPTSIVAIASGSLYEITIPAANTIAPGEYRFSEIITGSGVTKTVREGTLYVTPNFSVQQDPSTAQRMAALYEGVIAEFAATTRLTVNFNGQSFTRASIKDYQEQLVYWQSRVIAEARAIDRLRGGPDPFRLDAQFGPPFNDCPRDGQPWNR